MSLLSLFDNRTLHACQMLLALVFALVFFGVHLAYPKMRGVGSVALSFLIGVPGTFLLSARGFMPRFAYVSGVIAMCLIFAAFLLLYRGILHFLGSTRSLYLPIAASLITIAIIAAPGQAHGETRSSIVACYFTIALFRALIAVELFLYSQGRNTLRLFALSMSFFALISLNRGLQSLLHRAPADYLQTGSLQTVTLAATLVSICLTGLFFLLMCNGHLLALVRNESEQDPLSGAFNRRGIELRLSLELNRTERSGEHLSIALIDVDHFKAINDSAGHAAGDATIREVASAISNHLRAYDYLGRFGGDEFLLILPQTRCHDAQLVVDRLAQSIRAGIRSANNLPVTLSIGLTEAIPLDSTATLLARADKALYAAKHAGRNCSRALLHSESDTESLDLQTPFFAS